jgi:hypothetical protein
MFLKVKSHCWHRKQYCQGYCSYNKLFHIFPLISFKQLENGESKQLTVLERSSIGELVLFFPYSCSRALSNGWLGKFYPKPKVKRLKKKELVCQVLL